MKEAVRVESTGRTYFAEAMLLVATAVWGMSFALAKDAGSAINVAGGQPASSVWGQLVLLGARFALAAVVWGLLFRAALDGWTVRSIGPAVVVGVLLLVGIVLQHAALASISEAVTAFLTSTAAIYVPLLAWWLFKKRPPLRAWAAVAIAAPGIWLMADERAGGLGPGEWLGIACAVAFALHLVAINWAVPRDTPWRINLAQFGCVALGCVTAAAVVGQSSVTGFDWSVLARPEVALNVPLLVIFPTVIAFGLMVVFQPRVTPVRAVLIYLLEPVFAAIFAWVWAGRGMTTHAMLGGGLILLANLVVELWGRRRHVKSEVPVPGGE